MTQKQLQKRLEAEYDRIIAETLAELKRKKPLTKKKLAEALMEANKRYWVIRIALTDKDTVDSAETFARTLAYPYANAAKTFSDRVRNIYSNYESAFSLTHKDAKELLDKVVYDCSIAENLKAIAEDMPDGEEKTRILAEISAPAYRYRVQRAEELSRQAKETCDAIAKREVKTERAFLQTQTEKAYNITADEIFGKSPAEAVLDEVIPEPIQLRFNEMPKASEPVQEFTPTTTTGVHDSFSLVNTKAVNEITKTDWSGNHFSERVWNNTDKLAAEVKKTLIEGELTGASEADMAAKIAERFEVGMHAARRVVRTESNYCINQAELKGMKDAGYDEYEFISLGENAENVCDICDALDGQKFKVKDAAVGVNMPPMHPFCRCKVTTPEESLEDIEREIDERIKSWNIPEGMSLDEFIERVNNGELEQIREKQEAVENSSEGVDNSEKSGIIELSDIQTGEHIKTDLYDQDVVLYDITDERINSVDDVQLSTLDEKANQKLTDECKSLLDYVRNDKTGTEAAFVFDREIDNRKEFKAPDANGHVNFTCTADKSVVIHNHPDGLLFSEADLQRFEADEKLQILGAIGNNGSTYFVEKTDTYDHIGFYDFLGRSRGNFPIDWTNEEQLKYSESILKECGNYGINVYIRQN